MHAKFREKKTRENFRIYSHYNKNKQISSTSITDEMLALSYFSGKVRLHVSLFYGGGS